MNLGTWQRNREVRSKVSKILVKTILKSTTNVLLLAFLTIECPTKVNCQMLQMFLLKIRDEFRSDFQKLHQNVLLPKVKMNILCSRTSL